MKKKSTFQKLFTAGFILVFTMGFQISYGQGVDANTNCITPIGAIPGGPEYYGQFFAIYSDGVNSYSATQPEILGFLTCDVPPTQTGATTVHSLGCSFIFNMAVNGGAPNNPQAPAQMTYRMTKTGGADPQTGSYQTEMLQLDIQGGTLPPGVMIRESPTLQSTGQASITHNGTGYHIDSFFDIFTELSTDGGMTWMPSSSGPGHVVLRSPTPAVIPTMNEWGMITFSVLMLTVIMMYVRKGQLA